MSKGVIVTKNDISQKYLHVGQQLRSGDGSVGRLTGWLQPRQAVVKGCAINIVTINSTSNVRSR